MYASELSRLHRRYSFIFTMKEVPSLHQEVRHFLRLWLLEHRTEPEITAINERLCKMQETVLQNLENNRTYGSLRARLEDEEWIGIYLDLIEQQCWLDVGRAMLYILPFIIAAAFYAEYAAFEVIKAMEFFQADLKRPYREWWLLVTQMLLSSYSSPSSIEEHIVELKALERLISVEALSFPSPPLNKDYHQELEALVWYKLGMTYQGTDDTEAASWYEQALTQVNEVNKLRENIARQYVNMTIKHHNKRMYDKCLPLLDRAIAIKPDFFDAYYHRADIYVHLKQYQRALLEIEQVFVLLTAAFLIGINIPLNQGVEPM